MAGGRRSRKKENAWGANATIAQHSSFRFDETKNFSDNCKAFLVSLEKIDADMAVILRDNWDALIAIVHEGERDLKARGEFNSKIISALDLFLKKVEPKEGV